MNRRTFYVALGLIVIVAIITAGIWYSRLPGTTEERGKIIIDKVTIPAANVQSFSFSLTGGPDNINQAFSLTDSATPHDSGFIKPGTYNATEVVPAGWDLTSAVASDGSPVSALSLQANETITVTFTNTLQPGNLVVNAKGFNGTTWNDIVVQMVVDNQTYDTPFTHSITRFTAYTIQTPNSVGNYNFSEWDNGQTNLIRTVSLDFATGDLSLTVYYSLPEFEPPSIYTFEDGFESDLSTWTASSVKNGTAPTISTSVMRTGTASCRFQTNPTLLGADSIIYKTISPTDDVYARAYVQIPEGITSMQTDDRFYLIRIVYGTEDNLLASLGIRRNGTDPARWCLITAKNETTTRTPKFGEIVNASELSNNWTCVELHWNKTGGIAEVWINGELQITYLSTPGEMSSASNVQFGIYKKGDDGTPPPTGEFEIIAYFDDCIIDNKHIGI